MLWCGLWTSESFGVGCGFKQYWVGHGWCIGRSKGVVIFSMHPWIFVVIVKVLDRTYCCQTSCLWTLSRSFMRSFTWNNKYLTIFSSFCTFFCQIEVVNAIQCYSILSVHGLVFLVCVNHVVENLLEVIIKCSSLFFASMPIPHVWWATYFHYRSNNCFPFSNCCLELVSKIYLVKWWLCFFTSMSTMFFPCSQFGWQDFLDKGFTWLNLMNSWLQNLEPISSSNLVDLLILSTCIIGTRCWIKWIVNCSFFQVLNCIC